MAISKAKAVQAIQEKGILLVYPLQNKKEPASLWGELFPRKRMRWEWDENGDQGVADLWHTRAQLSCSGQVFYGKWFRNRATFFSLEVFVWMRAYLRDAPPLSSDSRNIMEILETDSPLSTKQLKEAAGLQGKLLEPVYEKALRPLWQRLLITGFGEVEDSSFPSLAVGASRLLFEESWQEAESFSAVEAQKNLIKKLGEDNEFWKFAKKLAAAKETKKS